MSDDRDETVERVKAALKKLPPADAHAVARVLSAVHGRKPQPTPRWREFLDWMRAPSLSLASACAVALVALAAGYLANGQFRKPSAAPTAATVASTPASSNLNSAAPAESVPLTPANAVPESERLVPVQFVLDLPGAHSVSVVGDFNDWTINKAPMQKLAGGAAGTWNITLPMKPGRHEYAFVVDGHKWMADPRAAKATDSDFGKPGSVIVVNTP